MSELNTFSVAARCPRTGMFGVAVSTAVPAVGGICSFIKPGVGAVATQSWVNPYLGIDGLKLLEAGHSAQDALDTLLGADEGRDVRQLAIIDRSGGSAAHTGAQCTDWCGHIAEDGFSVQGNMLTGAPVVERMAETARASLPLPLPERLMLVLEAAQAAGGDKRGKQSAHLKVYWREEYPYYDVRVDEHRHPVAELRRVFEIVKNQLVPFIEGMPKRDDVLGHVPEEVRAMLMTPPQYRAGGNGGT